MITRYLFLLFTLFLVAKVQAQKDSLQLGDSYAEDQLYISVSYAQFYNQPSIIARSRFSYGLSAGFLKDITLNRRGTISFALGFGYGYDFFNHKLKVEDINNTTSFYEGSTLNSNIFKSHNLEFPLELRWRTSNAQKYDFWRIYGGVKFLYNLSNTFQFVENSTTYSYKNVNSFRKLQYGLTLSAGFDEFNINVFYSLTPMFEDASLNGETINTSILKVGLIFYFL